MMSAAGGASSAFAGARLGLGREAAGADSADERSATVDVAGAGAAGVAGEVDDAGATVTAALVSGAAEDAAIGADAVDSDVEAEASVGDAELEEEGRGPRSSVADADRLKSANIMAHTMTSFTRPPWMRARALTRKPGLERLNVDFRWRFLPQSVRVKIRRATE